MSQCRGHIAHCREMSAKVIRRVRLRYRKRAPPSPPTFTFGVIKKRSSKLRHNCMNYYGMHVLSLSVIAKCRRTHTYSMGVTSFTSPQKWCLTQFRPNRVKFESGNFKKEAFTGNCGIEFEIFSGTIIKPSSLTNSPRSSYLYSTFMFYENLHNFIQSDRIPKSSFTPLPSIHFIIKLLFFYFCVVLFL